MSDEANKALHDLVEEQTSELSRMSERLFLATKAARIGVWDWDIPKNELAWDDSMYRLYGLQKGEFGGAYDAWARTIHPEDRARIDGEIQAALRGEREYGPEFRIVRPDGAIRHIKADSQTFRGEDGKPLRMVGTNIDITEHKLVEARLKDNEARYRSLFEGVPDALLIADIATGVIRDVNPSACLLFARTRDELVGVHQSTLHPPQLARETEQSFREHAHEAAEGKAGAPFEHAVLRSDGTEIPVEIRTQPVLLDGEKMILGVFRDISERKRVEEALQMLNSELEQRVRERTKELEQRNHELEQMNKAFVGREMKMVELKKRIEELEKES